MKPEHLRIAGVIGAPMQYSDADLGLATAADRSIVERLEREHFVQVIEVGYGQRDHTYTVQYATPTITSVPAPRPKHAATPPEA